MLLLFLLYFEQTRVAMVSRKYFFQNCKHLTHAKLLKNSVNSSVGTHTCWVGSGVEHLPARTDGFASHRSGQVSVLSLSFSVRVWCVISCSWVTGECLLCLHQHGINCCHPITPSFMDWFFTQVHMVVFVILRGLSIDIVCTCTYFILLTIFWGQICTTYGAFPLHGTARYGTVRYGSLLGGFPLGTVPGTWYFFSTTSVEVPSEPYRYQNVTCKLCWSLIDRRESSLLRHWTCNTRPSLLYSPTRWI